MSTTRLLLVGIGWWVALMAFYLLLVAQLAWQELLAGGVAAMLAAVTAVSVKKAAKLRYLPSWYGVKRLLPVPLQALRDCGVLAAALWRRLVLQKPVHGVFRAIPFDPGGDDDPRSAARCALVTAGVTMAPNTMVVAIDREQRRLLLHQLVPTAQTPGHGDREWPI